jgi:hypothetical protein
VCFAEKIDGSGGRCREAANQLHLYTFRIRVGQWGGAVASSFGDSSMELVKSPVVAFSFAWLGFFDLCFVFGVNPSLSPSLFRLL